MITRPLTPEEQWILDQQRRASGLCIECGHDIALPNEELCRDCMAEARGEIAEDAA